MSQHTFNRRQHARFVLPPMYTSVTIQRACDLAIRQMHGHAYDVSESGVRFELDEALEPGEAVCFQLQLPGERDTVSGDGTIVRVFDEADDPGPRRAALQIRDFLTPADRARLLGRLGQGVFRRAA